MQTSLRICDWTTSRTKGSLTWNYPRRAARTASETLSAELNREALTLDQMQTDEWLMSKESKCHLCQSQPTSVSIRRDSKHEIARTLGMGKVKE